MLPPIATANEVNLFFIRIFKGWLFFFSPFFHIFNEMFIFTSRCRETDVHRCAIVQSFSWTLTDSGAAPGAGHPAKGGPSNEKQVFRWDLVHCWDFLLGLPVLRCPSLSICVAPFHYISSIFALCSDDSQWAPSSQQASCLFHLSGTLTEEWIKCTDMYWCFLQKQWLMLFGCFYGLLLSYFWLFSRALHVSVLEIIPLWTTFDT